MNNKELSRKDFLKKGFMGLGTLITVPALIDACMQSAVQNPTGTPGGGLSTSGVSPSETEGPFPTHTPTQLVQSNIVSDRKGIALLINFKVVNASTGTALAGTLVDIWHCDAEGFYSEYGGSGMQAVNFNSVHFLRGRQTTDANGEVNFVSIYPGWYRGRAPHLHVEILNSSGSKLLVTQVAFPENISDQVYVVSPYKGQADTSNAGDNVFIDSLAGNMADSVTGNNTDGYKLVKTIRVSV
jgi:protocatechuate 3,4-dioxygenase beta subunit